jgi:hypothetical protein
MQIASWRERSKPDLFLNDTSDLLVDSTGLYMRLDSVCSFQLFHFFMSPSRGLAGPNFEGYHSNMNFKE